MSGIQSILRKRLNHEREEAAFNAEIVLSIGEKEANCLPCSAVLWKLSK